MSGLLATSTLLAGSISACSPAAPKQSVLHDLRDAERVIFEVDYMPGSQPATEPLAGGGLPWQLFQWNITQLLPPQASHLSFPQTLSDMGQMSGVESHSFTSAEIKQLAAAHQDQFPSGSDAHFHVLFLDGTFNDGTLESSVHRAVHLDGTRIFAVFGGAGAEATDFEALQEQAALIHEFGHALGLVAQNDKAAGAIPQQTPHSDGQGHCAILGCVMNTHALVNEELLDFATGAAAPILFGAECKRDLLSHYDDTSR